MHPRTRQYINIYLHHLHRMESAPAFDILPLYDSLYDEMYAFFLALGLSEEAVRQIIHDFRQG